jgi:hypothetical protein
MQVDLLPFEAGDGDSRLTWQELKQLPMDGNSRFKLATLLVNYNAEVVMEYDQLAWIGRGFGVPIASSPMDMNSSVTDAATSSPPSPSIGSIGSSQPSRLPSTTSVTTTNSSSESNSTSFGLSHHAFGSSRRRLSSSSYWTTAATSSAKADTLGADPTALSRINIKLEVDSSDEYLMTEYRKVLLKRPFQGSKAGSSGSGSGSSAEQYYLSKSYSTKVG